MPLTKFQRGQVRSAAAAWSAYRYLPLRNVWLGTSCEDQAAADERIPHLLATPAAVRFLSCEPLLGPISFRWNSWAMDAVGETYEQYLNRNGSVDQYESIKNIHWVIVGGESGVNARPMNPEWVRTIRDQCAESGTAFFFKQWGAWAPNCLCDTKWAHKTTERPEPGSQGVMFRCGKNKSGRLLFGVEHNAMPTAA